jgi:Cof subfamily protein (haloacid dehalogenase superfamily)
MSGLYITDLDHTFLRTDLTVSAFSRDIWNTLAKHHTLSVATARSYQKSTEFLKGLTLNAPLILLDGTMVALADKTLIDLQTLAKPLCDAIIEEAKKFDILPFMIAIDDPKALNEAFMHPPLEKLNAIQTHVMQNYLHDPRRQEFQTLCAKALTLKIVYFGEKNLLQPLTEHLQATFGNEIECKLSPEKYTSGYFLTILPPKGDKAHALLKVAEYLNKEPTHMTVFGDSINDIGMFKLAGNSVAVSNALDELKVLADVVLPHSNDEDGVAKYLEKVKN